MKFEDFGTAVVDLDLVVGAVRSDQWAYNGESGDRNYYLEFYLLNAPYMITADFGRDKARRDSAYQRVLVHMGNRNETEQ